MKKTVFLCEIKKNNIATQVLEKNKLSSQLLQQKEQAQLELGKTYRDLNNATYQRTQQEKAVEQATEASETEEKETKSSEPSTASVIGKSVVKVVTSASFIRGAFGILMKMLLQKRVQV